MKLTGFSEIHRLPVGSKWVGPIWKDRVDFDRAGASVDVFVGPTYEDVERQIREEYPAAEIAPICVHCSEGGYR